MTTFDEVIAGARRPETAVPLCLRGDLDAEWRELERQLPNASRVAANLGERSEASVLAEKMAALREQMLEAERVFRFRAMHPRVWSDFHATQPEKGKDEDLAEFKARWFAWVCKLVSDCAIDPVMTPEQVAELVDVLSGAQWDQLSNAAYGLNASRQAIPFSAAVSALTPTDKPS